jgi:hypothetical protein
VSGRPLRRALPPETRQALRTYLKGARLMLREAGRELGGVVLDEFRVVEGDAVAPEADELALKIRRLFDGVHALVAQLEKPAPCAAPRDRVPPPGTLAGLDRKSLAAGERE